VKRVSITAEDQALLRSPHHFSDNVGVSDDDEKDDDKDPESSEVAEILRQMSQGVSHAATLSGTLGEQFALRKPVKRPIPTSFLHESDRDSPDGSPSASKRVRWSNEAAGSLSSTRGGPFVPSMSLSSHTGQQAATNRFFHKMRRGVVSGKVDAVLPARSASPTLPKAPVLKPIPGLEAYDVLLGRDFISHFNLGNRRFMVLAYPHLVLFKNHAAKQDEIAGQLIKSIREAGGRFVRMDASCGGFEELSERVVPFYVKNVLQKLSSQQNLGGSKGLVQMFQRDCTNVWGGAMSQAHSLDEPRTPAPLQVETLRPSKGTIPAVWSSLDEETHGVTAPVETHGIIAPVQGPGTFHKLEPQTPLLDGFKPGRYDVICCRGRGPRKHPGNLWFVKLVESKCERYVAAKGKVAKSFIVTEVLDTVRKFSGDGGFVKKNPDDGKWYEVGDHLAREKIGQVRPSCSIY
jgi:hypothetical protein